jgi:hypothetical protein
VFFQICIGFNSDPDPAFYVNANPDADPDPDLGFLSPKTEKYSQLKTFLKNFKLQFTYPLNIQAPAEAFTHKR